MTLNGRQGTRIENIQRVIRVVFITIATVTVVGLMGEHQIYAIFASERPDIVSRLFSSFALLISVTSFGSTVRFNKRRRLSECIERLLELKDDDAKFLKDSKAFPTNHFGRAGDVRRFLIDEAIRCFSGWIAADVTNWELTIVADNYAADGEAQTARDLYIRALAARRTDMESVIIHRNFARVESRLGSPQNVIDEHMREAEKVLQVMRRTEPLTARYELATSYLMWTLRLSETKKDIQGAKERLRQAVDTFPLELEMLRLKSSFVQIKALATQLDILDELMVRMKQLGYPTAELERVVED